MMDVNKPLVSIVIPNSNKGRFIASTLDCLIKQTYISWEAIIVDDGSTDNSIEVLKNYAAKEDRFKVVTRAKQDHGGSVCRNIGIDMAAGEYIMFLDSDDLLVPNCLELRTQKVLSHSNLDFAVFACGTFREQIGDNSSVWIPNSNSALKRFLGHDLPWNIMQPIYRTDFIKTNSIQFPENTSRLQDVFFNTEVLLHQPRFIVGDSKPDCFYRISNHRKTISEFEFYKNWVDAVVLYVNTYKRKVEEGLKREVNKTAIYALFELQHAKLSSRISKNEFVKLVAVLRANVHLPLSVTICSKLLILLPFHVPGLRRMFLALSAIG